MEGEGHEVAEPHQYVTVEPGATSRWSDPVPVLRVTPHDRIPDQAAGQGHLVQVLSWPDVLGGRGRRSIADHLLIDPGGSEPGPSVTDLYPLVAHAQASAILLGGTPTVALRTHGWGADRQGITARLQSAVPLRMVFEACGPALLTWLDWWSSTVTPETPGVSAAYQYPVPWPSQIDLEDPTGSATRIHLLDVTEIRFARTGVT